MAVVKLSLKKKGLIDIDALYGLITPFYTGFLYDFYENKHKDKGYEIQYSWTGEKEMTEYVKSKINVFVGIFAASKVDVKQNGKTQSMVNGSAFITIEGDMAKDYEKKLAKFPKFKKFYEKYLIKGKLDSLEDDITDECLALYGQMKAILELE